MCLQENNNFPTFSATLSVVKVAEIKVIYSHLRSKNVQQIFEQNWHQKKEKNTYIFNSFKNFITPSDESQTYLKKYIFNIDITTKLYLN